MSLIHPAIIEEFSRKKFGLAQQTKMFNIFDRQTDEKKACKPRDPKKYILKIWSNSIE